jgi:hypothetical protein
MLPFSGALKPAGARRNNIQFIARVRFLRVGTTRRVKLHGERTMLKQFHETVAGRRRESSQRGLCGQMAFHANPPHLTLRL